MSLYDISKKGSTLTKYRISKFIHGYLLSLSSSWVSGLQCVGYGHFEELNTLHPSRWPVWNGDTTMTFSSLTNFFFFCKNHHFISYYCYSNQIGQVWKDSNIIINHSG